MSAVCGDAIMRAGKFFAEFMILQHNYSTPAVGVVAAEYDASGVGGHINDAATAHASFWIADSPAVLARGWDIDPAENRPLAFEVPEHFADADVVGLLLDLTAGSLELYFNGERKGMLIPRGLTGPVKWVVEMATPEPDEVEGYDYMVAEGNCASVNIETKAVPDPPAAEVVDSDSDPDPGSDPDSDQG